MIGVLRHQHVRHRRLGRDTALNEARRRGRLDHDLLAGPAGILRPAGDEHAELSGDDVEAFGDVLAHGMERTTAAGAGLVLDVDDLFDPRQMGGQRTAVGATLGGAGFPPDGVGRLVAGEFLGLNLLGLLQRQQQLVLGQALGPPPEAVTLHLLDNLAQPLVLGALRGKHRLKRDWIVARRVGRIAHEADSIMYSNALPASSTA